MTSELASQDGRQSLRPIVDQLIKSIGQLIEGNHASASDITEQSWNGQRRKAGATVQWHFAPRTTLSTTRSGNPGTAQRHFGSDYPAFERAIQQIEQRSRNDAALHAHFLTELRQAGVASIAWKARQIHEFPRLSVHFGCSVCSGSGTRQCMHCNGSGWKHCWRCHGSGRQQVSTNHGYVPDRCPSCLGQGRHSCNDCFGRGQINCGDCNGSGFFTEYRDIACIASPAALRYDWSGDLRRTELLEYWSRRSPSEFAATTSVTGIEVQSLSTGAVSAIYAGYAEVCELHFLMQSLPMCVAVTGIGGRPIVTAPIFDHLFKDEIAALESLSDSRGRMLFGGTKAQELFHAYLKQPALERAIRAIGKSPSDSTDVAASSIVAATGGHIGPETASRLGKAIHRLLSYVSPTHSASTWMAAMLLASTMSAITFATDGAIALARMSPLTLISASIEICLLLLVLLCLAWPVSAMLTWRKRLRTPEAYRRKANNITPARRIVRVASYSAAAGIVYGLFVTLGLLPSVNPTLASWRPPTLLLQQFGGSNALQAINHDLRQWAMTGKPQSSVRTHPEVLLRDLQRELIRLGYHEIDTPDGKWGPRTRAAVTRFEREHDLEPMRSVDELLAHARRQPAGPSTGSP